MGFLSQSCELKNQHFDILCTLPKNMSRNAGKRCDIIGIFDWYIYSIDSVYNKKVDATGDKNQKVCGIFVQESLYGAGITYTFTTANCLRYESSISLCACFILFYLMNHCIFQIGPPCSSSLVLFVLGDFFFFSLILFSFLFFSFFLMKHLHKY